MAGCDRQPAFFDFLQQPWNPRLLLTPASRTVRAQFKAKIGFARLNPRCVRRSGYRRACASASASIRSIRCLTRSPIETIPTRSRRLRTTGRWRIRRLVISASAASTSTSGAAVIAGDDMIAPTLSTPSAVGAMLAEAIDDVALAKMPTISPSITTGRAPIRLAAELGDRVGQGRRRDEGFDLMRPCAREWLRSSCVRLLHGLGLAR